MKLRTCEDVDATGDIGTCYAVGNISVAIGQGQGRRTCKKGKELESQYFPPTFSRNVFLPLASMSMLIGAESVMIAINIETCLNSSK